MSAQPTARDRSRSDIPFKAFAITRTPSIGIERAHLTLLDAARFLSSGLGRSRSAPIEGRYRAKVIGNGLRELDRFLSVLLDEVALATGWERADLRKLTRLHNTTIKLRSVSMRLGLSIDGHARLSALGRCRATLFYNDGVVRRGDTRQMRSLTLGWPADMRGDGAAATVQEGEYLAVSPDEIAWICQFYTQIADQLAQAALLSCRSVRALNEASS